MQSQILGCQRTREQLLNARSSLRNCSAAVVPLAVRCFVLVCAFLATSHVQALPYQFNFTGTEQNFDATIDLTGNVFADGNGTVVNTKAKLEPFGFKAPLNHPLSLFGGEISLSSDPKTNPLGTIFDVVPGQLVDMTALNIDLLNGQTADFALDTIFLTTNSTVSLLKSISIDVSGTLTGLRFDQTGAPTIVGVGSGTFSVPGDLTANVDNLSAVVFGLLQIPVDSQSITIPYTLTGTWTNPIFEKIELDGDLNLSIPLSLLTNLTTAITDVLSLTISSTIDLAASLAVDSLYHLEYCPCCGCPEPGSIALLGIGLAAVAGVTVHRRRGRR